MTFNSLQFAIFLPIVFVIYWWLQKNMRLQNLFVVVASYVFYGYWDYRFLFLIVLTSAISWGSGLLIGGEADNSDKRKAKLYLIVNIIINLLILGVFKYFNFFVQSFCDLFGATSSITIKFILPVGISFYTFQALSYSIDVYRRKIEPTRNIIAFFAYVSFFPQLVAGPIERATNLLPQFEKKRLFNYDEAVNGCRRILWGLFKKIVIADNCARYVNIIWDDYYNQSGSTLALAAILFAFQIYGDFSGYSDIAIGSAKLFGINLKDNFLTPYFSRNAAEFWKRWHISLNTWFVDYLYIPLGGSRNGKWNTIRNTLIIFLLSGLWHGANWTYVIWGLYHAVLFVPLIIMGRTQAYKGAVHFKQMPQIILTFSLVTIGWIIFRAPSITQAAQYIYEMFSKNLLSIPWLINRFYYIPLFANLFLLILVEWCIQKNENTEFAKRIPHRIVRWAIYLLLIVDIMLLGSFEHTQFIYFQF